MACQNCADWPERKNFDTPREYLDFAREMAALVDSDRMRVLDATCDLQELLDSPEWPADVITHQLQCASCGRKYTLSADTYHGGAQWY